MDQRLTPHPVRVTVTPARWDALKAAIGVTQPDELRAWPAISATMLVVVVGEGDTVHMSDGSTRPL